MPVEVPDYGEPPPFGPWLEAKREERGWSQEHLARMLDLSLSGVRSWLYGRSSPQYEQLFKIRVLFGSLPWEE